jgi:hypothetical protein
MELFVLLYMGQMTMNTKFLLENMKGKDNFKEIRQMKG